MRGWLRAKGFEVGDKDCQALWDKLSREYYPFRRFDGSYAWLSGGIMGDICKAHASEFLVTVSAGNPVH